MRGSENWLINQGRVDNLTAVVRTYVQYLYYPNRLSHFDVEPYQIPPHRNLNHRHLHLQSQNLTNGLRPPVLAFHNGDIKGGKRSKYLKAEQKYFLSPVQAWI